MLSRFPLAVLAFAALIVMIIAGWSGGPQNDVDFLLVAEAAKLRQADPLLTHGPAWLSLLGNAFILLPLSAIICLVLLVLGKKGAAGLLFAVVVVERLLLDGLKILIGRERPDIIIHPVETHSFSFPSGHAANTMTVLVAIALFALPRHHRRWSVPTAIALAALVGLTRPWLGVHWPSDILAGWMLAALVIMTALWADQRWRITDRRARNEA